MCTWTKHNFPSIKQWQPRPGQLAISSQDGISTHHVTFNSRSHNQFVFVLKPSGRKVGSTCVIILIPFIDLQHHIHLDNPPWKSITQWRLTSPRILKLITFSTRVCAKRISKRTPTSRSTDAHLRDRCDSSTTETLHSLNRSKFRWYSLQFQRHLWLLLSSRHQCGLGRLVDLQLGRSPRHTTCITRRTIRAWFHTILSEVLLRQLPRTFAEWDARGIIVVVMELFQITSTEEHDMLDLWRI